jgi:hypothetical protein
MKTISVNIYSFNELSDKAKDRAINDYRNKGYDNQFYYDEIIESCKAVYELFGFDFGLKYTDIRTGQIDDNILELSGVRLYTYIMNNYGNKLFKPKYIKCIDRHVYWKPFICKRKEYQSGPCTFIYSRNFVSTDCTLTGFCYDNDILQPVYDFLKKPGISTTFEDIIKEIENAIQKTFDNMDEWLNSDEFISDHFCANDYEFTENGKIC